MGFHIESKDEENENEREMWTSLGALSSLLHRRGLKRPFCFLQESAKREVLADLGESDGAWHFEFEHVYQELTAS